MSHLPRCIGAVLVLTIAGGARRASAQHVPNNPYTFDLRTALFPVAFQAGVSQSHFGSAARGEFDLSRRLVVQVSGQLPWANVTGQKGPNAWSVRAGVVLHIVDEVELQRLVGTVYPADTPAIGHSRGTDRELEVPVSQRMGGPRMSMREVPQELSAPMRRTQSLRFGYDLVRAVERGRPDSEQGTHRYFVNTLHGLYAGYSWGAQWNLTAEAGGGKRRVGWRRFYVDGLLTLDGLDDTKPVSTPAPATEASFFPLGLRIGMEGAIAALLRGAPGVGFGYSVELGALPGKSGFEGYLLLGFGLELDAATRPRDLR